MITIIMEYQAKCKHCLYFEYRKLPKKDGTWSKKNYAFCENTESDRLGHPLTLKSLACNKIKL